MSERKSNASRKEESDQMPGGDRTGPWGLGPMTGRRAGYCMGFSTPGFANPYGYRMGFGYGRGMGMGFGRRGGRFRGYAFGPRGGYQYMPYGMPFW
jgi:hypothetical protein